VECPGTVARRLDFQELNPILPEAGRRLRRSVRRVLSLWKAAALNIPLKNRYRQVTSGRTAVDDDE
jgi:hypothetical protein